MANTKVSALAAATSAAFTDELLIIADPGGSPASKRIDVSALLQTGFEFGQVYTSDGSGTQSPGASYVLCTQVASDGLSSAGVTPAAASNKITVANAGIYLVAFSLSYVGTNSAETRAAIFWDGNEQAQISIERTMGAAAAVGVAATMGFVDVTTGATDIDIRIKTSSGVFAVHELQLVVVRVGNT